MQKSAIILASTSTIRRAILENAGLEISCQTPMLDEAVEKTNLGCQSPKNLALRLAELKALSITSANTLVVGADQTLSCENIVFHKPESQTTAKLQLSELRGKTHILHSAATCALNGQIIWSICEEAHLTMRRFSDPFLDTYINACGDDILSSAGSYQLEKRGVQLFEKIEGDYFTILGLPLLPLLNFLREHGAIQT
jgi:septum formation protein